MGLSGIDILCKSPAPIEVTIYGYRKNAGSLISLAENYLKADIIKTQNSSKKEATKIRMIANSRAEYDVVVNQIRSGILPGNPSDNMIYQFSQIYFNENFEQWTKQMADEDAVKNFDDEIREINRATAVAGKYAVQSQQAVASINKVLATDVSGMAKFLSFLQKNAIILVVAVPFFGFALYFLIKFIQKRRKKSSKYA